jgi:hypothetical protein
VDSAGDVLEQEEIETKTVILPDHLRCATHTLNLVATKDSERAMDNAAYKKTYRASMAKATALWNIVSRSTKAADAAFELLGYHFTVPVITRWHSYYDSVKKIVKADDKLTAVATAVNVIKLQPQELPFLCE